MKPEETNRQADVSVNGNLDGNIIVGNGNQITVSPNNNNADRTASELAIRRLEKEIETIKGADSEISEIKKEFYLPTHSNFDHIKGGLLYVISEIRQQKPSSTWLKILGESGFTDDELNAVFKSLKVDEMEAMKTFYSNYFKSFKKPPTPAASYAVRRITEDLDKIKELEESKALLPQKMAELQKHRKIVEII